VLYNLSDLVELIRNLTFQIATIAWVLFLLSWVMGWAIRGSPVPFIRVKRIGQDLIEDAILAAFWLAMGTTIFSIIAYIISLISVPLPEPPLP